MLKTSDHNNRFLIILLTGLSLGLWCYLFRLFLSGGAPLQDDAYPYLGHVRFYLENITKGVYPLWNPSLYPIFSPLDNHGTTNEFFLRRIGEYNPFFWAIVLFEKTGIPFITAYRLFLASYFFLGLAGFYLLTLRLLRDHLASFTAALLLLFSGAAAGIFETYLLLEIVPYIWFAYFLTAFVQEAREKFALGAVFSLMIINITYIPFYFYTILFVLSVCALAVYAPQLAGPYRQIRDFISRHKVFSCICSALLILSFVPGISWYQQSKQGEISMIQRHSGSEDLNSATVSIDRIDEGGIIPDFIFLRQFGNLTKIGLDDFYLPLFAYLMLFAGAWGRTNRRLVLFFIFSFIMFLIGLADASYLHKFLYDHILFFKYFRNVQFFLWFAILPAFILFVVQQMKLFIDDCRQSLIDRKWITWWVILVHLGAAGFFLFKNAGTMTYAVIIFNMAWMLGCIWSVGNPRIWLLLLWGAIILQPFEVYSRMAIKYPPEHQWGYDAVYGGRQLPSGQDLKKITDMKTRTDSKYRPYFCTRWLYEAIQSVDNGVLTNYLSVPFIAYDQIRVTAGNTDAKRIERSMAGFEDIAFVYSAAASRQDQGPFAPKARIITAADKDFKVLRIGANDAVVRTAFTKPLFLVRTENYHSQWKAFIDDKPVPLLRTNICAQGLWVPAGEHVVRWHFGSPKKYAFAYFLVILYPAVLIWLISL